MKYALYLLKDFNVATTVLMTKFLHEGYKDICIHLELPFSFDMPLYTYELSFQINLLLLLDINLVSRWPGYRQQ